MATLAAALAAGNPIADAIYLANKAAGIVVRENRHQPHCVFKSCGTSYKSGKPASKRLIPIPQRDTINNCVRRGAKSYSYLPDQAAAVQKYFPLFPPTILATAVITLIITTARTVRIGLKTSIAINVTTIVRADISTCGID